MCILQCKMHIFLQITLSTKMHIASNSTFLRIWRRCAFLWKGWFAKVKCTFLENFPPDKNAHRLQILKNVEFEAMCIFVERLSVKCTFLENFPPDKNAHHLKILKSSRFWRVMCKKCAFYGVFFANQLPPQKCTSKMHIQMAHFKKCTSPNPPPIKAKTKFPNFKLQICECWSGYPFMSVTYCTATAFRILGKQDWKTMNMTMYKNRHPNIQTWTSWILNV